MTEEELVEFLKENLTLGYEYESYRCDWAQVTLILCGEKIASTPLYGLEK